MDSAIIAAVVGIPSAFAGGLGVWAKMKRDSRNADARTADRLAEMWEHEVARRDECRESMAEMSGRMSTLEECHRTLEERHRALEEEHGKCPSKIAALEAEVATLQYKMQTVEDSGSWPPKDGTHGD
jgi:chromosome segregation ATPase